MPRVSVLLPARDAAVWLAAAIASLEAQTFSDYEVIAVNDGSTDATGSILDAWALRDGRVRVLHRPARGIVASLEEAATEARGELLARMDADDVAYPTRLAEQVALLDSDASLGACGTQVRYFPRERVRGGARRYERWLNSLTQPAELERDLYVECPIAHPALMVRRELYERAGGYQDRGWPEDYDLVLRIHAAGGRLANVPSVLLDWREGDQRLSRTHERYAHAAFQRCKAHYIAGTRLRGRQVVVWGAGPVGKGFARALAAEGVRIAAFVDLDPRKIGQVVHGAHVIAPDRINEFRGCYAVAAVAGAAARTEIRAALAAAGWEEVAEFCAVA